MADIRPFKAVRPREGMCEHVAALPYDVFNEKEAREEITHDEHSFLRIDRAETLLPEGTDPYSDEVYQKARSTYEEWKKDGVFIQDDSECYYIYSLTMDGRRQTGIAAVASVDDYENNVIKKHENTRADKEADRIRHVDTMNAQTGPIFLAYRDNETIDNVVTKVIHSSEPLYDFTSEDGIRHTVYKIDDTDDIKVIEDAFKSIDSIYIADGHHRCASAVRVSQMRRRDNAGYTGNEEFNYFLSVLFPDDELMIMDYNRTVRDLNGMDHGEFIEKIKAAGFTVEKAALPYEKPVHKGTFGMYLDKTWYKLTADDSLYDMNDPVKSLDVSVLQDNILGPVLGICDPRTDGRIDFIGGIRGMEELEKRADTDMKVSFALYPTSIHELFNVADHGLLMPPKSTWFEPKLRSGIFIHEI
ncbi:MAG: DUF1015 domain-containing protein [Lachnospiraceae bacterium]|nr:DUF1015 domain-containing protein [Lachnospiraceae bacterium]MEE3461411.1 DUF1015 domain-containing protein [Lachnospiraceae bacterium]